MTAPRTLLVACLIFFFTSTPLPAEPDSVPAERTKPKLVLQITVDALRGDLPLRSYDRFGEGGFRYLYEKGAVYRDAHHAHANTETIVGHVTLATGAHPAAHGMVGNVWFDRALGRETYNIEDPAVRLLTAGAGVDSETEIDPTQKSARSEGRSPRAIMVSTFSDELAIATAGKAKIFGVSVKDRGAVSLAGHAGKAFWFSKQSGRFVSSTYYYERYPDWVEKWNQAAPAAKYAGKSWELLADQETYLFGDADDREYETDFPGFGRVFPHPFGPAEDKYFTTRLTLSPAGDEMTLDFAKTLLLAEDLGQDEVPDYLSVSFSSTDYIGHIFGPSSLEAEDNLRRLDRTLAELLRFVDEHVGLENTLIAFSADHGTPEAPGYLESVGIEAGYVEPETWDRAPAIAALKKEFGIGEELIRSYSHPYLNLNRKVMEKEGLDPARVERAVAELLTDFPGVAIAVGSSTLRSGNMPDTMLNRAILRNFNPSRSGDIYIVFDPHWFIADFDGLHVATTHGSPWTYDSYVPLIFAGAGIKPQRVSRRVHTVDLAVTLAAFLGTKPPSGAAGRVLPEVVD